MGWIFRHFIDERLVYEERCAGFNDAIHLLYKMSSVTSLITATPGHLGISEMRWTDDQNFDHKMTIREES